MNTKDKPLISVVTVVFNGAQCLEDTINSVLSQTYPSIEYLVIDGGSRDGTVDIIRKYASRLGYWTSEPDKGIYDAMNKGAKAARGEWIIFMNAGDRFYSPTAIADVFAEPGAREADAIYGGFEVRLDKYREGLRKIVAPKPLSKISHGMICSHQSLLVRTSLLKEHPFDLSCGMAADYDLLVHIFKRNMRLKRVEAVISSVSDSGVSDVQRLRALLSLWRIAHRQFGIWGTTAYYCLQGLNQIARSAAKTMLPDRMVLYVLTKCGKGYCR